MAFFEKRRIRYKGKHPRRSNVSYPLIFAWFSTSLSPSDTEVNAVDIVSLILKLRKLGLRDIKMMFRRTHY